ncbi:MAG: Asp-tRNA(Asn)/Glu-tRNA(Gln) amidotransferase GatCAB subunit C [Flavobacteriales bacterium]|nr:MAG: Asp-tRNA(Asn)/Glu-tRNA(Gln) amidotransferase GatCAB subunit C [Flavobacteriales bacterium]
MSVNNKTVEKIAELAKLEFNDVAKEDIKADLNKMLDFIDKLSELNTNNVEPLIYMLDETPELREDEVKGHVTQKEALKNAPDKDSDYFKVPIVIKK